MCLHLFVNTLLTKDIKLKVKMSEFDYQWKNLPSSVIEYNEDRVNELLLFTSLPREFFDGINVLDAGCGNGRYTYAMMELGANVVSIDTSKEAIEKCLEVNPNSRKIDILEFPVAMKFNFILSFGVLHHMAEPYRGFIKLASLLEHGGILHLMLYNEKTQKRYNRLRTCFKMLDEKGKLELCKKLSKQQNHIHGWYDALNPEYNYGFTADEITGWFRDYGFIDINLVREFNININGKLK